MRKYNKVNYFPIGIVVAGKFIKEQRRRSRNGICRHLYYLKSDMMF